MDQTIRDAHQSLWATRMSTEDMAGIARLMDNAGFFIIDLVGGAVFDACVLYLREDPFERIRIMRRLVQRTPLNFISRGQTVFRWTQYPDDVAELTIRTVVRSGCRSVMVFDPLNDMRNLAITIRQAKEVGSFVIGSVTYTVSPVHTNEHFAAKARDLMALGVDAVELKDPSGLLTPERTRTLVPALRAATTGRQLQMHSHCTSGLSEACYAEALDLVDLVHGASEPMANGWSLPSHEFLVRLIREHGYEVPIDERCLSELAAYFRWIAAKRKKPTGAKASYDPRLYEHQVPGGMMSNLVSQLSDLGVRNRLDEVLDEIVRVRRELGYPIMVSPLSQYIGAQAVLNVLGGERYKVVPDEVRRYALGYYGELAAPIDPAIADQVTGGQEPTTVRPGEMLPPMVERSRAQHGRSLSDEELVLALFYSPQQLSEHRTARAAKPTSPLATTPLAILVKELARRGDLKRSDISKGGQRIVHVF